MRIWLFLACDITIASAINMCMTIVHPSLTQNELRTPLDLSAFSCQQISVSFAVVSKYNISQYSPRSQICVPGCKYMHTSLAHLFYCHSLPRGGYLLLLHNIHKQYSLTMQAFHDNQCNSLMESGVCICTNTNPLL